MGNYFICGSKTIHKEEVFQKELHMKKKCHGSFLSESTKRSAYDLIDPRLIRERFNYEGNSIEEDYQLDTEEDNQRSNDEDNQQETNEGNQLEVDSKATMEIQGGECLFRENSMLEKCDCIFYQNGKENEKLCKCKHAKLWHARIKSRISSRSKVDVYSSNQITNDT